MKRKLIIISLLLITIIFSLYLSAKYIGTKGLVVKEYKIEANITDNFHGLKIVHFSDLHYDSISKDDLINIINKINLINPDIVVYTGDLIDKNTNITEEIKNDLIENFKNIKVSIGKYAVNGEHDGEVFQNIMDSANFEILNNSYELIYKDTNEPILLAGINYEGSIDENLSSIYEYINNNSIQYKILLTHIPDNIDKINNFNLVLAGHSHKNQINIPIIRELFKVDGALKYYSDYYEVNNTKLYISSGLGTTNYRLRLFNKPSFNFYRITKES